jgi:hypothetical protein
VQISVATRGDVGLLGQVRCDTQFGRGLTDVLCVVQTNAIERPRNDRYFDLDFADSVYPPGYFVSAEWVAGHLADAITVEDAVGGVIMR